MNECIGKVLAHKGRVVETTTAEMSVAAAVEHMNDRRIGALVVMREQTIIGIFTERDVLVRVVAAGKDPMTTRVQEVMTENPVTVRAEMTVADALTTITERRCRHLPVIDDAGLCGLISIGDLTSWIVRDQRQTIEDLHNYIRAA